MFTILLILCIGQDPQCYTVKDLWGPYGTREACERRLHSMTTDIEKVLSPVIYFEKKCIKNKEGGFV